MVQIYVKKLLTYNIWHAHGQDRFMTFAWNIFGYLQYQLMLLLFMYVT
jgi:hypothetical protein